MSLISRRLSSCRHGRSTLANKAQGTLTAPRSRTAIAFGTVQSRSPQLLASAPRHRLVTVCAVASEIAPELAETSVPEAAVKSAPEVVEKPLNAKQPEANKIKVSKSGKVHIIAGKIAHSVREGNFLDVVSVGPRCTNIAVKAIAISRTFLSRDNLDLSFQPVFREIERGKDDSKALMGVVMRLAKVQTPAPTPEDAVEMHIGGDSKPWMTAGALAARVREQRTVHLTAIGASAVRTAVLSLDKARQYLRKDRKDIRAVPEFIKVKKNEGDMNAIKFTVVVEDRLPN